MLFVEGVSSSYTHIVSLSLRGQRGSNTIAQFIIEPWEKREAMKVITVSNDTLEGLTPLRYLWKPSYTLPKEPSTSSVRASGENERKPNEPTTNRGHQCISQMRGNYSPSEHAGLLAAGVVDLVLDTCTEGKRCTVMAATVSCFGHGGRQRCAHPELHDKSTFFRWNII